MKKCIIHNWYQGKDLDGDFYWTCSGCLTRMYTDDPNSWSAYDMKIHAEAEAKRFEKK